nr:hypothetical protein [Streptomyces sp. DSM 41633]
MSASAPAPAPAPAVASRAPRAPRLTRRTTALAAAVLALLLAVLLSLAVGARSIPPGEVFDALLHGSAADRWALGVLVQGSALTTAYPLRFVWRAFARKPGDPDTPVHRVGWAFLAPPA